MDTPRAQPQRSRTRHGPREPQHGTGHGEDRGHPGGVSRAAWWPQQALRCRCAPRGVCTQAPCYCIIMEFCAQGQLYEVLRAGRKVTPSLLVDWSMGIAGGMNYLHLHKIIHRDLKSPK